MFLKNLSLINFKNYTQIELQLSSKMNCFVGNNGVGKTNLLDAIHYLSLTKSYFNSIDTQNIKHGEEFFVIQGAFQRDGKDEAIYCGVQKSKKKQFKRNKKEYGRLADHIGLVPVVMISPADSSLILEGSEQRRKFMDSVISQYDRLYLDDLINYNKALSQRNALLKEFARSRSFDEDALLLWDEQLIPLAQRIYKNRKEFIKALKPIFQDYYNVISKGNEEVALTYDSHLHEGDFKMLLENNREKDRILQYTTVGTHKDDLQLGLGDHPIKRFGSQGQQKTYLVALKLAKFGFIEQVSGFHPILLLDDVFDKFDAQRVKQIIQLVAKNNFGQIFITDTNLNHLEKILEEIDIEHRIFRINDTIEVVENSHS